MKRYLIIVPALAAALALSAMGCKESAANHKLVGTDGKHSVALYPDEATYEKTSHQPAGSGRSEIIARHPRGDGHLGIAGEIWARAPLQGC